MSAPQGVAVCGGGLAGWGVFGIADCGACGRRTLAGFILPVFSDVMQGLSRILAFGAESWCFWGALGMLFALIRCLTAGIAELFLVLAAFFAGEMSGTVLDLYGPGHTDRLVLAVGLESNG